jgi:rhodanese-related sulfurtransferase/uncharacterized membrane protein YedE/YeeE
MIQTYYSLDALGGGSSFFATLVIGFFFGLALERAGFGSSRRISGIFYFTDMAVLKVMFTALVVAMLGLAFVAGSGMIDLSHQIYFLKTYYGAYVVAGLIFGVGFVMSGWCPGTAAVGLASGKIDALLFLVGAIIGSVLFNELFPILKPLYTWGMSTQKGFGQPGLAFIHETLGISRHLFLLLFTIAAILCFWGAEYIETIRRPGQGGAYFNSPFLKAFCLVLLIVAASLPLLSHPGGEKILVTLSDTVEAPKAAPIEMDGLLEILSSGKDHMEPEELAALLLEGESDLIVVDVRPEEEYARFHIREAVNVQLADLPAFMRENRAKEKVVLYSNGMTHPAQARDALFRQGFRNVLVLTDGLTGFLDRCLKPVSLRPEPVDTRRAGQIRAWRDHFLHNPSGPLAKGDRPFASQPPQSTP